MAAAASAGDLRGRGVNERGGDEAAPGGGGADSFAPLQQLRVRRSKGVAFNCGLYKTRLHHRVIRISVFRWLSRG